MRLHLHSPAETLGWMARGSPGPKPGPQPSLTDPCRPMPSPGGLQSEPGNPACGLEWLLSVLDRTQHGEGGQWYSLLRSRSPAQTLEPLPPAQEGGAQLLADLSHGSLDRKC